MKYKSWDEYYSVLLQLYRETGSINVPAKYVFAGLKVGEWISRQRGLYKRNLLKKEKKDLLESIGIDWDGKSVKENRYNDQFVERVKLVSEYKAKHGNTQIPNDYIVNGVALGKWASNLRQTLKGKNHGVVTKKQLEMLHNIGFEVDWYQNQQEAKWHETFRLVESYASVHGIESIQDDTVFQGKKIGRWIHTQRVLFKSGRLPSERYNKLLSLGLDFSPSEHYWMTAYQLAKKYYEDFHDLNVPNDYLVNGFALGRWISNQRQVYNHTRSDMALSEEQIAALESIGMVWHANNAGNTSFAEQVIFYYLRKYYPSTIDRDKSHGFELDIYIPDIKTAIEYDGVHWHENKLHQDNLKDEKCRDKGLRLIRIREYPLPATDYAVCYQREDKYDNASLEEVLRRVFLEQFSIKIDIDIARDTYDITENFRQFASKSWYAFYKEAKEYYDRYGNLLVPASYVTPNGIRLGSWIQNQRQIYKGNSSEHLSRYEIELLEDLSMVWDVREYEWYRIFSLATEYYKEYGNLLVPRNCIYKGVKLGKWINTQRSAHNGARKYPLSKERTDLLESIGMVWKTK